MFQKSGSSLVLVLALVAGPPGDAADLKPQTVAAFDRYVTLTERRIDQDVQKDESFLWIDTLPAEKRQETDRRLRAGQMVIERLETRDQGKEIKIPDGLVHHWLGIVFVPGATVDQAVALFQNYDRHAEIFKPAIVQSKILARDGDRFKVFLRFYMKKVIAVTMNTEHDAQFFRAGPTRAYSRIRSTRTAEVDEAGTPREHEKPPNEARGFLWRLNSYWRFEQRTGGTYVQCESITLTRGIPFGFGWLIGPFVTSIPKDSLTFMLETTRKTLTTSLASTP